MKKFFCLILMIITTLSAASVLAADDTVLIDGVIFSKDKKTLLEYHSIGRRSEYEIPDGVTAIADSAFKSATFLESVSIPDSVKTLGKSAFAFCSSLQSITLPKGVTKIPDYAFDRCTALEKVEILGKVTVIGIRAFNECRSLKSINIPTTVKNIENGAFDVCSSLIDIAYDGTVEMWNNIEFDANNLFITSISINQFREMPITITIDGKAIANEKFDQPPIIENGRTLVPLRVIFEALGAEVTWEDETQTVGATKGDTVISLQIGSAEMKINDTVKTLDVPAKLVNSRTLVPVRAVAEAFGCKVGWDGVTNTVIIETKK